MHILCVTHRLQGNRSVVRRCIAVEALDSACVRDLAVRELEELSPASEGIEFGLLSCDSLLDHFVGHGILLVGSSGVLRFISLWGLFTRVESVAPSSVSVGMVFCAHDLITVDDSAIGATFRAVRGKRDWLIAFGVYVKTAGNHWKAGLAFGNVVLLSESISRLDLAQTAWKHRDTRLAERILLLSPYFCDRLKTFLLSKGILEALVPSAEARLQVLHELTVVLHNIGCGVRCMEHISVASAGHTTLS